MVSFNNECPSIQVGVELLTAVHDGQEFPLDVGHSVSLCLRDLLTKAMD